MTYAEWVDHHCRIFAFTAEADVKAMLSWRDLIEAENHGDYALADLTRELAATDYPSFARDHLKALLALIRRKRAETFRHERAGGETHPDFGTCSTCDSSGRVTVPHLKAIVDGRWIPRIVARGGAAIYYTCAVTCHCQLGRWFEEHAAGQRQDGTTRRPMTLLEYTHQNPSWASQIRERRALEIEEARLTAHPASTLQPSLDRLRNQMAAAWMLPPSQN